MGGFKFELGQHVEDVITGYRGVVMGRTQYLTQCNSYGITPMGLPKDRKRPDWEWFDEPRIKCLGGKKLQLVDEEEKTGGVLRRDEVPPGK